VDYSAQFIRTTMCAGYDCADILPEQTTHYPCMRHCYLMSADEARLTCNSSCPFGSSFEGLTGLKLFLRFCVFLFVFILFFLFFYFFCILTFGVTN
jgi:hypothetical protein